MIPAIAFPFSSPSFVCAKAITLMINPIPENGITIQFNAPKQGKKPIIIPTADKIPKTKLAIFILFNSLTFTFTNTNSSLFSQINAYKEL